MKNIFILVFVLALTSGQNFNCGTGADSIDLVQTGKLFSIQVKSMFTLLQFPIKDSIHS